MRALGRLAAFFVVARFYSVHEFAEFNVLIVVGAISGVAGDFGFTEFITREVPAGRLPASHQRRLLWLRLSSVLATAVIAWLALLAVRPSTDAPALGTLVFASSVIGADFLAAYRRAQGSFHAEVAESGVPIVGALATATVTAAVGAEFGLFQLMLGSAALAFVAARFAWALHCLHAGEPTTIAPRPWRKLIWDSRWFFLKALATWALIESIVLVLDVLGDQHDVALFGAALRPVGLMSHPFLVLGLIFAPSLAHDFRSDPQRMHDSAKRLNLISLLAMPAGFTVCVVGGQLLLSGFGSYYVDAENALRILALGYTLYFGLASGIPLIVSGRERAISLVSVWAAVVILVLGFTLVPTYGAIGAAIATFAALTSAKLAHALLYLHEGIPLGSRRHAIGIAAVLIWFAGSWYVPAPWNHVIVFGGAVISAALSLMLLLSTSIFTNSNT